MAKIILIIAVFTAIGLFEVPKMLRKMLWRELLVFSFLLISGFTLSILLALDVPVPSPARGIRFLTGAILRRLGIHVHYS